MNNLVNLRIETADGRHLQLSLSGPARTRVKHIKQLIKHYLKIPMEEQELIYHDTTSQLLLHDEAILYPSHNQKIAVRPKAKEIRVHVRVHVDFRGMEFPLTVNLVEPIASLKRKIQHELGVSFEDQKLYHRGAEIVDDEEKLHYYQISDNSVIKLLCQPEDQEIRLFVISMTGSTTALDMHANDLVSLLKTKIHEIDGISPDIQRLIFAGKRLEDQRSLSDYNIQDQCTIHLVLKLRGMISSFSFNDQSDPLVRYLMLPENERVTTPFPLEAIHRKEWRPDNGEDEPFFFEPDCKVLGPVHRALICRFLDFMWSRKHFMWSRKMADTAIDMKLVLPDDILVQLLTPFSSRCNDLHLERYSPARVLKKLKVCHPHGRRDWDPKVALRMTKGPTNACIDFHQDGGYATYTMQLALNDPEEYQGGKLCYVVENRLHALTRPAGSLVGHRASIVHGVTALMGGVRKSLFLVDESNGLGERDVHIATPSDIAAFWDSDVSNLCSYCYLRFADQACGSCKEPASICTECSQIFHGCPRCRIVQMVDDEAEKSGGRKRKLDEE